MKNVILLLITLFASFILVSCSDPVGAERALKEQGYTNIQITGFDWRAKGEDDITATGFIATSATGTRVKGAVTDKGKLMGFIRPQWNIRIWKTLKDGETK